MAGRDAHRVEFGVVEEVRVAAPHGARMPVAAAFALILILLVPRAAGAAGTFHVDNQNPLASDTNPGTEAFPYRTISAATAARNGPGTTIVVYPGVYRETVIVPSSGTSAAPFVYRAFAPGVVVEGSNDFSSASRWAPVSGSVYCASSVTWSAKQVFVDGARLTSSMATPSSLPVNSFTYVAGEGLYVNVGGANPGTRQTHVGRRAYGFYLAGRSHVTVDGFTVTRTEDRAVFVQNASNHVVIRANAISFAFKYGIAVNACASVLVDGNTVGDNQDHGIGVTGSSIGCTVRGNECYRNADPTQRVANGIYVNRSTGNILQNNNLHHNQDSGLHLGSFSHENVTLQNVSWSNGDHGFDYLNSERNLALGNVAYGNFKDGFSIEGSSSGTRVFNCIGIDNGITTNEYNLWVDLESSVGFESDYNIFWNSTTQPPVKYIATRYSSVAAYSAASGQDAHTLQADAQFVAPATGNFELLPSSPAIDAANSGVASWVATDALGRPRVDDPTVADNGAGPISYADRGAFEFQLPGAPVVSAPAAVFGRENARITVSVSVSDPDGDPISSLTASDLPAGATFTAAGNNLSGTLAWTPSLEQSGIYAVLFTASNAGSGSATTVIRVQGSATDLAGRLPLRGTLFPNPLRSRSKLVFATTQTGPVEVSIFDVRGRLVRRLSHQANAAAGLHLIEVDGRGDGGQRLATGKYFYRIHAQEGSSSGHFIVAR